ncbi:MAG: tetratricopeptide repeat protein [Rhizomicrobium sp.]
MRAVLRPGAAALLIAFLAVTAAPAQTFFDNWSRCNDARLTPVRRIEHCKRLVDNGGGANSEVAVLTVLGGIYRVQHDYPDAIQTYSRAIGYESLGIADRPESVISPGSLISLPSAGAIVAALEGRAEVYALTGRTDLALADTAEIFKLAPDAATSYAIRCRIRAIARVDLDKALADCAQGMKRDPKDTEVVGAAGLVQYRLGHLHAAADDFDKALASHPKLAGALYMRGVIELKLGKAGPGNGDIATAKAEDPTIAASFSDLGIAP